MIMRLALHLVASLTALSEMTRPKGVWTAGGTIGTVPETVLPSAS